MRRARSLGPQAKKPLAEKNKRKVGGKTGRHCWRIHFARGVAGVKKKISGGTTEIPENTANAIGKKGSIVRGRFVLKRNKGKSRTWMEWKITC